MPWKLWAIIYLGTLRYVSALQVNNVSGCHVIYVCPGKDMKIYLVKEASRHRFPLLLGENSVHSNLLRDMDGYDICHQ